MDAQQWHSCRFLNNHRQPCSSDRHHVAANLFQQAATIAPAFAIVVVAICLSSGGMFVAVWLEELSLGCRECSVEPDHHQCVDQVGTDVFWSTANKILMKLGDPVGDRRFDLTLRLHAENPLQTVG